MQVALSGEVSLDVVTKLGEFIFRKIVYAGIGVNTGFCEDLLGGGEANAVDIGQADFNALVARKVDTNETCHEYVPFLFNPDAACDEGSRRLRVPCHGVE